MENNKENSTAGFKTAKQDSKREKNDTKENLKGVENHIKAAEHFYAASKHHYEAAKHHNDGNHEIANHCALLAIGHASLARKFQIEDAVHHAVES